MRDNRKQRPADTILTHAGRHPHEHAGIVNPPVYHASTVLFPTLAALRDHQTRRTRRTIFYGRYGTPTTFALEDAVAELEGGFDAIALPSGLSAITTALLSFLKAGDHLLIADSVYGPARLFCETMLKHLGVAVTFYDPVIGAGIAALIRDETRMVYTESPGSLSFEVQDIPAIAEAAHRAGALVMTDNTWATPLYFRPFDHGVDVSVHAGTKYIVGHSDAMMGLVVSTEACHEAIRKTFRTLGNHAGPDDCYMALRGLRSMRVRLERHSEVALRTARWLEGRPEVRHVLYPPLASHPTHDLWKRDFLGGSGLMGVVLAPRGEDALAAMVDHMRLFSMGYSWGGFESLIMPDRPDRIRSATRFDYEGDYVRLHIGLEDPDDLVADLEAGLARFMAT